MVFSSHVFLFYFLTITLAVYFIMVALKINMSWVNFMVTIASYCFYGWTQPWLMSLMFAVSYVNFLCGKFITRPGATPKTRNLALIVACIVSLGALGFFKYYMFFMGGVNRFIALLGGGNDYFHIMTVTLPIGISFYTFQALSYTIDVWRNDAPPVKDFKTFSCFVALFPQLIAGPIVRYNTVAEQLAFRTHTLEKFAIGSALFILGYVKKILLANPAGEIAKAAFNADGLSVVGAWWGILGYHFQIYFDFCAYSDMAVGLGRMMGFEFIKNFNAPYFSQSFSEFWNRWHISLSTWIRDYLYISLGGNRRGNARTYFNLAISMFLCGLWHGAKMTFIIWGIIHGAMLIWERTMGRQAIYRGLPRIPKIIITNILVMFTWVIFRAPSLDQALLFWGAMLGIKRPAVSAPLLDASMFSPIYIIQMAICAICVWHPIQAHEWVNKLTPVKCCVLIVLFFLAIVSMFTQSFNPFLYFQF